VYEPNWSSEGIPVVDLSFEEEDAIFDTSRDEEFTKQLFSDLNRGLLGPPDHRNIIILSNSDEEEEVHEEDTADAEATPPSTVNSPAPTIFVANAEDVPEGVQDDNSDGADEASSP
jgi:hypothetical protein